jgi:hypothetical protein
MKGTMGRTGRAFAALAFVGALGFGTVQAFAGPATPGGAGAARYCEDTSCSIKCRYQGAVSGHCSSGVCICTYPT